MESRTRIEVISKCRGLLNMMNLCRKDPIEIRRWKIPNIFMFFLISTPMLISISMETWQVFESDVGFLKEASVILMILGSMQILSIYYSLALQNKIIVETVNHIQSVVNRSNFKFIAMVFLVRCYLTGSFQYMRISNFFKR